MLLSILIPIYGVEEYIERCAISLFEQTLQNHVEFIFVNDCTKDDSVRKLQNLLKKYPHRMSQVKLLHHDKNRGLAASRQTALEYATGDYVLTVDSDDWLELDTCEALLNTVKEKKYDILMFDYIADYNRKHIYCKQNVASNGIDCLKLLLTAKMHGGTCTKLIKRSLYFDNKINYIEGLNMFEDISVVYRLFFCAHTVGYIKRAFYHYYQGNQNSYCTKLSIDSRKNLMQIMDLMEDFFRVNNVADDIWKCFDSFKVRVFIMLLSASEFYEDYKKYGTLLRKNIGQMNMPLSLREKWICRLIKYTPFCCSILIIGFLNSLKRMKSQLYN